MSLIKFEIVTPERVVLKETIKSITVPTKKGIITILPRHIPLVGILVPGVAEIKKENGEIEVFAVSSGFIEVQRDKVIMLADTAELAKEIDIERAKKRAEEVKKEIENKDDVDFAGVQAYIEKELARVKAANRWRDIKK
ncbi:MAG: ATP synthase F1 subunit epsilon [Patescibacteria group bacterium]|nr:ATP synthase F1 subunit epsilon [Patescibacteria group bacterium]MDD4304076.1 ATP synthase F1 subunit epsilon [Patescibacteria group bacterium]MDD4694953.1 ATP synthase F1 subunit epsilon [Patescibacteria group bacterium]